LLLEEDSKGALHMVNNYSMGGQTGNVEMRQYFLRQLKEESISKVIWIPGELKISDLYTKNLARADFEKHAKAYVGEDTKYTPG
jgi:hypothetical protein